MSTDSTASGNLMGELIDHAHQQLRSGAFCFVLVFADSTLRSVDQVTLTGSIQCFEYATDNIARQSADGREPIGFVVLRDVPKWGKHAIRATGKFLACADDEDASAARNKIVCRLMQDLHSTTFCRGACPDKA